MNKKAKLQKLLEMQKLMEKRNALIHKKIESQPGYGIQKLLEGELERAELILAAKDVVNRLQDMAESLAKMQVEDMMPLVDSMKGEFGPEQAGQFEQAANESLGSALDGVKLAREGINNHVLQMEGKLSDEDVTALGSDMGADEGGDDLDLGDEGGDLGMDDEEGGGLDLDLGDEEGDLFGGAEASTGEPEEELGRARKESAKSTKKPLKEAKKKVNETANSVTETDFQEAVQKIQEAKTGIEVELIADYYGFDLDELVEAYENKQKTRQSGSAIRQALGIDEGIVTSIAKVLGPKALGMDVDPNSQPMNTAEKQATDRDDDELEDAIKDDPGALSAMAGEIAKLPAAALKKIIKTEDAKDNKDSLNEHQLIEEIIDLTEENMLKFIKERIGNIKTSKSLSVKETFGSDIKLGTPRAMIKQLVEKYGDPKDWNIAKTNEGVHYVLSGAIPEEHSTKDTQTQITGLEEEINTIRKKHSDVKETYRLPQEFKLDNLRSRLAEYQTGYRHQLAKWLSLEEAYSIVEMAKKWHSKKRK